MKVSPEAINGMMSSSYNGSDTRWAAWQNVAMDSSGYGHLQFMAIGPRCTFKELPERCPDTSSGLGWKYSFCGWVDLEKGIVVPRPKEED